MLYLTGVDLVAEKIGWFGQGWNSPSHTNTDEKNDNLVLLEGDRMVNNDWGMP